MRYNKCFLLMFLVTIPSALHCMDIFQSVYWKNFSRVQELINNDPTLVNARNRNERTPLHIAVEWADKKIICLLLQHKADINAQDQNKMTPLHLLLKSRDFIFEYSKQKEIIQIILDHHPNLNAKNDLGFTPLNMVAMTGNFYAAELLLKNGAPVNAESVHERNPLHFASRNGCERVAYFLLQYGVNVNACDQNSNTPLHYAACFGNVGMVYLLLTYGANINHIGSVGCGPVYIHSPTPSQKTARTPLEQAKLQLNLVKNDDQYESYEKDLKNSIKLLEAWPRYQHYRDLQIQAFRESVSQFPDKYRLEEYILDEIENRVRLQWKQDKIEHVHELAKQEKKLSKSCIVM